MCLSVGAGRQLWLKSWIAEYVRELRDEEGLLIPESRHPEVQVRGLRWLKREGTEGRWGREEGDGEAGGPARLNQWLQADEWKRGPAGRVSALSARWELPCPSHEIPTWISSGHVLSAFSASCSTFYKHPAQDSWSSCSCLRFCVFLLLGNGLLLEGLDRALRCMISGQWHSTCWSRHGPRGNVHWTCGLRSGGAEGEGRERTEGTGRVRTEIYCGQGKAECLCKISDHIIKIITVQKRLLNDRNTLLLT